MHQRQGIVGEGKWMVTKYMNVQGGVGYCRNAVLASVAWPPTCIKIDGSQLDLVDPSRGRSCQGIPRYSCNYWGNSVQHAVVDGSRVDVRVGGAQDGQGVCVRTSREQHGCKPGAQSCDQGSVGAATALMAACSGFQTSELGSWAWVFYHHLHACMGDAF